MRFFARVRADVDRQCAPLNEALHAACVMTRIRSLVGVYSVMSLQIRFPIEALLRGQQIGYPKSGYRSQGLDSATEGKDSPLDNL